MRRWSGCLAALILVLGAVTPAVDAASTAAPAWSQRADLSVRGDARTGRTLRGQYRLRYHGSLAIDDSLGLNTMVATGDGFASAWNTALPRGDDPIHVRRLFLRARGAASRTEVGVIPSLKGTAASTGLSQDGWLTGIRHVRTLPNDDALEAVVGELDRPDEPSIWNRPGGIDYLELEYSSEIDADWSWESGADMILGGVYLRGELRRHAGDREFAAEFVQRVDEAHSKWVLSVATPVRALGERARLFAYYIYTDPDFGERAELTEDFLATGHAFAAKFTGRLAFDGALRWFVTIERYASEDRDRLQAGLRVNLP